MNKRIESLQALRAVAFGAIFLHHCGLKFGGGWGVSVFLILSGFLMVYNHQGDSLDIFERGMIQKIKGVMMFSWNKIRKLYPLHIAMSIIAIPFMVNSLVKLDGYISYDRAGFLCLANLLLVQSWFPPEWIRYSMNNLSWYLCVCVLLYSVFPFLRALVNGKDERDCISIIGVLYIVQVLLGQIINGVLIYAGFEFDIVQGLTYNFPVFRLFDFVIGCFLGRLFLLRRTEESRGILYDKRTAMECLLVLLVMFTAGMNYCLWNNDTLRAFRLVCMNTPSATLAVWLFAQNGGLLRKPAQTACLYGLEI